MPELPEVETVRRGLQSQTTGRTLEGGEVLLKRSLAYPLSVEQFSPWLAGDGIQAWQRRGKYLLAQLASGGWLGVHLRMTGQLFWVQRTEPLEKHTRIRLFFDQGQELRFVDSRTFGQVWLVPPGVPRESIITGLTRLGPEPFDPEFTPAYLQSRLQKTQRTIKAALLDQGIVAGLGNIYVDEVCFASGVRPEAIAAHLTLVQITKIHGQILAVLEEAIAHGGTTFSDFLNLLGVPGNYGDRAQVYGRRGQPCRVCGTAIERIKITGRSSHFCPQCQI
ncbi:MAG: DNA-formamidopyrimidine glycosylase [Spirulina sp. DLM2.Bin59]|nr:MAG: DNA-formamidopyrimidine glycosylase [Spirulina sp. DLM2.Bin59]